MRRLTDWRRFLATIMEAKRVETFDDESLSAFLIYTVPFFSASANRISDSSHWRERRGVDDYRREGGFCSSLLVDAVCVCVF